MYINLFSDNDHPDRKYLFWIGNYTEGGVLPGKGVRIYFRKNIAIYQVEKGIDTEGEYELYSNRIEKHFKSMEKDEQIKLDSLEQDYSKYEFHYESINEFLTKMEEEFVSQEQKMKILKEIPPCNPYTIDEFLNNLDIHSFNIDPEIWEVFKKDFENYKDELYDQNVKMFIERYGHGKMAFIKDFEKVKEELELVLYEINDNNVGQFWV